MGIHYYFGVHLKRISFTETYENLLGVEEETALVSVGSLEFSSQVFVK